MGDHFDWGTPAVSGINSSITLPEVTVTAQMPTNFAYQGAQNANTAVHSFNTSDFHIQQSLASVRTAIPVKVVRAPYTASGNSITPGAAGPIGFIDVQPLVNQWDGDNNATPHGTVYRMPYVRYQGGYGSFISDPKVGDVGLISVCDRDISVVKTSGTQGNPGSRRKHDLADGIYLGSIVASSPTQYVSFTTDGIIISDKNGNSIVLNASGISISDKNGNSVVMGSGGITITSRNGNGPIAAVGSSRTIGVDTHVHPGVQTGGGQSGPPLNGT